MPAPRQDGQRRRVLSARFTDGERQRLEAEAEASGVSAADLLRTRALGARVKPRRSATTAQLDGAARIELSRIGNNMNQIARALNTDSKAGEALASEIRVELARLAGLLATLEPRP